MNDELNEPTDGELLISQNIDRMMSELTEPFDRAAQPQEPEQNEPPSEPVLTSEPLKEAPAPDEQTEPTTPVVPEVPAGADEKESPPAQEEVPSLTPLGEAEVPSEEKRFEVEPGSGREEEVTPTEAEIYWHQVLTGNPETVPIDVRDRAGAEDAGLTPEQREYVLCSAINRSWLADHRNYPRRELMVNWGKYRAELAAELGVADDEKEIFVALSAREGEAARRAMARKVYEHAYLAALHGEQKYEVRQFCRDMSRDDRDLAEVIGINAYREGQIMRERCLPHARDLAAGFEAFYAGESQFFSLPDVLSSTPGLLRAIDDYHQLSEDDRRTTVYLAARLHREQRRQDDDAPEDEGLLSRGVRAVRRGAGNLGFGMLQAVNHTGIAMLDNLGELLGGDVGADLQQGAVAWDRRMQNFNEIRHLAQQENAPLHSPGAGRAEVFFLEGAQAVPAAVLSCCGGAGFGALSLSCMGESVAEARRRAPEGPQKLQLAAGVIAGAVQGGIYMALNRLGGRMFEQTLNNFMKARGSGMVNYTLAGLKSAGAMTVDGVKLMLANKAAAGAELGVHELAARAAGTASNIDWKLFGDNITDIECNLREAGATLPFLLIGAGRLALRHFRSPDGVLGSGRRLLEWKVPEKVVDRLLGERDIDLKNDMLREAVCESELWNDSNHRYTLDIMRAMQLLHTDRYLPFREQEQVRDFLNLSGDFAATPVKSAPTPLTERTSAALMLRSNWEQQAGLDGSRPLDVGELRTSGSGNTGVLNGRGCYRDAYMFSYENMAEQFTFLHRDGLHIPEAEPIRRAVLTTYADELQKCSYRMLLQLYPQDVMTLGGDIPLPQLKEQAEKTRRRYLNLVGRTIMDLAAGKKKRERVYDALAKECGAILSEYRESPGAPGWLRSAPDYLLDNIAVECRSYDNVKMDGYADMRTFYRLLHRTRVCAAVLTDFLPMSDIFQDSMMSGRSPAQAYAEFLSGALGYRHPSATAKSARTSSLRSEFEQRSVRDLELYMTMTGQQIEYSPPGENGARFCRMKRPDGHFTPWFENRQQLANSIAGHNVVLFAPIGSRADRFIASDFHNPDAPLTLPTAGELEYSPFDRLCSNAVTELAQYWMSDAAHMLPGMRRNTRKKLNVSLLYRSVDRPLVEYMPEQSGETGDIQVYPYNIDQYAMLTPAGLAYSRFIVYWARQLNSGIINAEEVGQFLTDKQLLSHEEMQRILNVGVAPEKPYFKNVPLKDTPAPDIRGMNLQMAEQMGRYTFLYFLGRMPELDLPWSVKTWYNSLAFCPEVLKNESPLGPNGAAPFQPGWKGVNALMWYNSQTGVRLRELAPTIEFYRNHYCGEPGTGAVEQLLPAAIDADYNLQMEQAWAHYLNGDAVFETTGPEFWNLLCHPLAAWQGMDEAHREFYAAGLREFCRETPLPGDEQVVDVATAAIRNLDSVLSANPSLHTLSYRVSDTGQLSTMSLQGQRAFAENRFGTPGWQLPPNIKPRADYSVSPGWEQPVAPFTSPEIKHALQTLDFLRCQVRDIPYQTDEGAILWRGQRFGSYYACPAGLQKWSIAEPVEGLRNALWMNWRDIEYDEPGPFRVAGVELPILSQGELECRALQDVTVYVSRLYAPHHRYRLMPGRIDSAVGYLRHPYLVGSRAGVHLGLESVSVDRVPESAHVPLSEFRRQSELIPDGSLADIRALRRRIAAHNLQQVFSLAARGPLHSGPVQPTDETLLELLMRLFEDTGFSYHLRNRMFTDLDVGALWALRLGGDMISCVAASDNVKQTDTRIAYERLHKTCELLKKAPEIVEQLLNAILPEDTGPYEAFMKNVPKSKELKSAGRVKRRK